ncbi:olfactory receptor 5AR1-like [Pelodytes ibericus]
MAFTFKILFQAPVLQLLIFPDVAVTWHRYIYHHRNVLVLDSTQLALTYLTEFTLLGLSRSKEVHFQILLTFTIIYIVTLLGNCLLIILIIADRDLLTPMYYFLCHLSFLDICCVSVTVPKMLTDLWTHKNIISYVGCFTQLYFFHFLGSSECFLLGIMSYDLYIAICHPLRYCQIINMRICLRLAAACWVSGIFFSFSHTFLVVSLSFCTSNVINHFFCDIPPLLQLSSTDTTKNILEIFILGGTVVGGCFSLTFISYILIILSILKIKSVEGKQKAFSTCASHLIIVSIFFGTILFMYLRPPSAYSLENDKLLSVFYNICTPMLNPVIYSFRNKEVKKALNRMLHKIGLIEAAVTSRFEKQITRPNVLSLDPSTSYQVASIKKGTSPTAVTSRFEKQITRPNVLSLDPSTSYQVASIKKGTSPNDLSQPAASMAHTPCPPPRCRPTGPRKDQPAPIYGVQGKNCSEQPTLVFRYANNLQYLHHFTQQCHRHRAPSVSLPLAPPETLWRMPDQKILASVHFPSQFKQKDKAATALPTLEEDAPSAESCTKKTIAKCPAAPPQSSAYPRYPPAPPSLGRPSRKPTT